MYKTKSMKKSIVTAAIIILMTFLLCACVPKLTTEEEYDLLKSKELPTSSIMASLIFDDGDINSVVGFADYIFVGKVVKYKDTKHDSADGIPRTIYDVKVLENIKGNLVENIEIVKDGGLTRDFKSKAIINNDRLPLEEEVFIFCAFTLNNKGDLAVGGNNSNTLMQSATNFQNDENYKKIVDGLSNATKFERERFKSRFDKEFK